MAFSVNSWMAIRLQVGRSVGGIFGLITGFLIKMEPVHHKKVPL